MQDTGLGRKASNAKDYIDELVSKIEELETEIESLEEDNKALQAKIREAMEDMADMNKIIKDYQKNG